VYDYNILLETNACRMDMKSLTARTNNRTKILNDMNKNDSSLAIADINK